MGSWVWLISPDAWLFAPWTSLGAHHNLALFGSCCSRFEKSICTNNFTMHMVKLFASVLNVTKTTSADTSNTAKQ